MSVPYFWLLVSYFVKCLAIFGVPFTNGFPLLATSEADANADTDTDTVCRIWCTGYKYVFR